MSDYTTTVYSVWVFVWWFCYCIDIFSWFWWVLMCVCIGVHLTIFFCFVFVFVLIMMGFPWLSSLTTTNTKSLCFCRRFYFFLHLLFIVYMHACVGVFVHSVQMLIKLFLWVTNGNWQPQFSTSRVPNFIGSRPFQCQTFSHHF